MLLLTDARDGIEGFEVRDLFGSDLVLLCLFGIALIVDDFDFDGGAVKEEEEGVEEVEIEEEEEAELKDEEEGEGDADGEEVGEEERRDNLFLIV